MLGDEVTEGDSGWTVWSMHVLKELERLDKELKDTKKELKRDIGDDVDELKQEIADIKIAMSQGLMTQNDVNTSVKLDIRELQVRAALIGGAGGMGINLVIYFMQHYL